MAFQLSFVTEQIGSSFSRSNAYRILMSLVPFVLALLKKLDTT